MAWPGIESSLQFADKFHCFRRLWNRRIAPAEFLPCSLSYSLPRSHAAVLGIPLSKYPMSLSLHSWGRHIGVTPPSERPASHTAGHVDHEKRTHGFQYFHACFFLCFSNFYRNGASLPGPSSRRSSAIMCSSRFNLRVFYVPMFIMQQLTTEQKENEMSTIK